ncbi:MAG: fasciclin domain-containing protein [Planctomycetota bacterium]|nr:fasciclin domain-containing protein [Planctomycetota bacterium]
MKRIVAVCCLVLAVGIASAYAGCGTCDKTVVAAAQHNDSFKTLVAAVEAAGLADALSGDDQITVFAPTNDAFSKLPAEAVADLLKPENKDQLVKVLTYHVVPGRVKAADVVKLSSAKTLEGSDVDISVDGGKVKINDAEVIKADIPCKNGVIHVIDAVLLPKA